MKNKFDEILREREKIWLDSFDLETDRLHSVWNKLENLIIKNMTETISFLRNECNEDEFRWMSEVFENVVKSTQNHEFVNCIEYLENKFSDLCHMEPSVQENIEYAKKALNN